MFQFWGTWVFLMNETLYYNDKASDLPSKASFSLEEWCEVSGCDSFPILPADSGSCLIISLWKTLFHSLEINKKLLYYGKLASRESDFLIIFTVILSGSLIWSILVHFPGSCFSCSTTVIPDAVLMQLKRMWTVTVSQSWWWCSARADGAATCSCCCVLQHCTKIWAESSYFVFLPLGYISSSFNSAELDKWSIYVAVLIKSKVVW